MGRTSPTADATRELLDEHARGDDKPEVMGDSAYGDAATSASLQAQGFTVTAKCPPARTRPDGSPRTGSPWTWHAAP